MRNGLKLFSTQVPNSVALCVCSSDGEYAHNGRPLLVSFLLYIWEFGIISRRCLGNDVEDESAGEQEEGESDDNESGGDEDVSGDDDENLDDEDGDVGAEDDGDDPEDDEVS